MRRVFSPYAVEEQMKKLGVAAFVAALCLTQTTGGTAHERFLGSEMAVLVMEDAARERPALSFRPSYARRFDCSKRISATRVKCTMSWIVGDASFSGRGQVWLKPPGNPEMGFSYSIRRLDEYCASTGGHHCVKWFFHFLRYY